MKNFTTALVLAVTCVMTSTSQAFGNLLEAVRNNDLVKVEELLVTNNLNCSYDTAINK